MQLLLETSSKKIEMVKTHPFSSEEELEGLIFENKEILGDLRLFGRQVSSGDGRFRIDLISVDGNGEIYVIELKNKHQFGPDLLYQTLQYADWASKNPLEIKQIWQQHLQEENESLPEPDWGSLAINILLIAPSFDSDFVKLVLSTQDILFRFMTIERYQLGNNTLFAIDHLEELEDITAERKHIPKAKPDYSWDTYLKTHRNVTEKNIIRAKSLAEDVNRILKELDLEWLRIQFNKLYISYKNGRLNVIVLYFENDGTPGLEFHIPDTPSKLGIDLPEIVMETEQDEWFEDYKCYYVPIARLGITVDDIKPLFLESKKYRC